MKELKKKLIELDKDIKANATKIDQIFKDKIKEKENNGIKRIAYQVLEASLKNKPSQIYYDYNLVIIIIMGYVVNCSVSLVREGSDNQLIINELKFNSIQKSSSKNQQIYAKSRATVHWYTIPKIKPIVPIPKGEEDFKSLLQKIREERIR